ncbi:MAG: methyltransferase domain-containing protein [Alphaproteobacteria bacterium]|nr:methyltransferase domain-containing protein [Alphaproteobacteria bacterium]
MLRNLSEVRSRAESLPVPDGSFDRAVLSLVPHQLANPKLAVADAFRSLAADGRVAVRTIAPEDVAARVPYRCFPSMSAVDTDRMPPLNEVEGWLKDAGFVVTGSTRQEFAPDRRRAHAGWSSLTDATHSFLNRSAMLACASCARRRKQTPQLDRPASNVFHRCL